MPNCAGCSCGSSVPASLTSFYRQLGFTDVNKDDVIEKKSFWNDEEGYKPEADINGDGRIIELEARYYLHYVMQNPPAGLKAEHPFMPGPKTDLEPLLRKRIKKILEADKVDRDLSLLPVFRQALTLELYKLAKDVAQLLKAQRLKTEAFLGLAKELWGKCGANAWLYGFEDLYQEKGKLVQQAADIAMANGFNVTRQLVKLRYFDLAAEATEYLQDPADEVAAYSVIASEMCQSPLDEERERGRELFEKALFILDNDPAFDQIFHYAFNQGFYESRKAVLPIKHAIIADMVAARQFDLAIETTLSLPDDMAADEENRQNLFVGIVIAMARHQEIALAIETMVAYVNESNQSSAIPAIANIISSWTKPKGSLDRQIALQYFKRLGSLARKINVPRRADGFRQNALRSLAYFMREAGFSPAEIRRITYDKYSAPSPHGNNWLPVDSQGIP